MITDILNKLDRQKLIEWFASRYENRQPFFYNSVDIRDSGFKIAPVDTNLFPAGFNNLSADAVETAAAQAKEYLSKHYPQAKTVSILAENFDRNRHYWDNINVLKTVIEKAGFQTLVTVDDPQMPDMVDSGSGVQISLAKAVADGGKLKAGDILPDVVIANRDFSAGMPEHLTHIQQPIIPSPALGWHTRRKSQHFSSYNVVAKEFADSFGIDPWLVSTFHEKCGNLDFKRSQGFEPLMETADKLLGDIAKKYAEYKIDSEPYLYIKADSGTFGMGIMTIKSVSEIAEMNKKLRNKMDRIKEGVQNTEVLIQEGVPTINKVNGKTAEPFLYCINGKPIGAILRVNETRDEFGNLNSAGMTFEPVNCEQIAGPCEFSALGIIARLACLAAVYEAEEMKLAAA